jgi:ribosome maturation factor RimP
MDIKGLETRVKELIQPVIHAMGIALDYVEMTKMRGKYLVRIYIEKEGGITLDDCESVSREIEAVLDVEDPIPQSYTLEVSSPGLNRPLRNPEDFKRFTGRTARVTTSRPIENQTFFIGEIVNAGEVDVVLLLPKDRKVTIPHDDISRARLEVIV